MALPSRRRAYSLLELVVSSFLVAIIVVPSLQVMRQAVLLVNASEIQNALNTFCVSTIEQQCAIAADQFRIGTDTGTSRDALFRYRATRSDAVSRGGSPGELMVIEVVAWEDTNRNRRQDRSERTASLHTKISRSRKS